MKCKAPVVGEVSSIFVDIRKGALGIEKALVQSTLFTIFWDSKLDGKDCQRAWRKPAEDYHIECISEQ